MSSSNADMISKRRFKLTKEIRKATLSGSEYYELKRVLETLELVEIDLNALLVENTNKIAKFNTNNGRYRVLEDGRHEFAINDTVMIFTTENGMIKYVETKANAKARKETDIILEMLLAVIDRPIIQNEIKNIKDTKERLRKHASLRGYDEIRKMIRSDTLQTLITIDNMDKPVVIE
ncbi:hypothetical protein A3206_08035 [Candidatus Methanomassiliicoccus intestinalis]|jgi:hypothetical protein|uniref:Uncharacterized protein n=1 Tax=Methanomassiliicoccus intestinalis (strain Issoire-Mx1) TaxID=1295009 RepID=R9T8I5_METII|nr:hypothetical protein [Candidatus Methanomassiliicoccus intestinalis]AGN26974.1 hypothetical protein MMINT_16820 [Candidatus Methanomassiliicoccus intestinalis Issoire-Mx1]TQS79145.1 MAG: hypothetical protein A3206_08035 [Candidatus Methanomassiliicoccus intestinalis]